MSLNLITCEFDEAIDDLNKIEWRFCFWPDKGILLEHRYVKSRATTRHSYRIDMDVSYDRLAIAHRSGCKAEFPEIPFEIQLKAVEMLRDQVKFKGDSGGKWTRF